MRDFDDKVVSKLSLLVDSWGVEQALAMLDHLEHRMRTKQGAMKNGPGYLDVAVCSHLDMLKVRWVQMQHLYGFLMLTNWDPSCLRNSCGFFMRHWFCAQMSLSNIPGAKYMEGVCSSA